MACVGDLACTYASLILQDDGIAITSEKISTLVKSAGVKMDSYWPPLFAKLLEKRSVDDLITNLGSGGGGGAGAGAVSSLATGGGAGAAVPAAAVAVEEKNEEPKEESDDDMGFSLFE